MLYVYMSLLGVRAPMASHVVSVMNYEYGVTKIRGYLTATTTLLDNLTGILLSIFFYYVGDWRILFWFNLALVITCFVIIFALIPESPRFYMAVGQYDRAREVFKTLAKVNKREMFEGNL